MSTIKLTPAEITALLAPKPKRKPKNYYYLRTENGIERFSGKPKTVWVGTYEGKVGSVQRTRKGATRRMPNGKRYYNGLYASVVAYKTSP